jgi:hypothetical protein
VLNLAYFVVSLLAYFVEQKLAFPAYCFAQAMTGKKGGEHKAGCVAVVIGQQYSLTTSWRKTTIHGPRRTIHVVKRQFMDQRTW